jgi:hypothetical protein
VAQPFKERSSLGNQGDVSFARRRHELENGWPAKDAILARKKFSQANRFVGRTDPSQRAARSTNGGCGLPAAAAPQQLSASYDCTLELAATPGHSH